VGRVRLLRQPHGGDRAHPAQRARVCVRVRGREGGADLSPFLSVILPLPPDVDDDRPPCSAVGSAATFGVLDLRAPPGSAPKAPSHAHNASWPCEMYVNLSQ
jgi:hypothetical protein